MHHFMEDSYDPVFGLDSRISDEQVISTLPHDIGWLYCIIVVIKRAKVVPDYSSILCKCQKNLFEISWESQSDGHEKSQLLCLWNLERMV